ncbi:hypothetical protein D3C87_988750 [compost metagenome]
MGPETYWPLISGFVGALIGAAGPVAVAYIQARKDERTHRREIASRLALADRDLHVEVANKRGGPVLPISIYLAHHIELLDRLSKGPISAGDIKAMRARTEELSNLLLELDKEGE